MQLREHRSFRCFGMEGYTRGEHADHGSAAAIARLATRGTLLCLKIMLGHRRPEPAQTSCVAHMLHTAKALIISIVHAPLGLDVHGSRKKALNPTARSDHHVQANHW